MQASFRPVQIFSKVCLHSGKWKGLYLRTYVRLCTRLTSKGMRRRPKKDCFPSSGWTWTGKGNSEIA